VAAIKTSVADAAFSKCVRERSDWHCERCGTHYPDGGPSLHCSHVVTRGNHAVRYSKSNAMALCFGCHRKVEGDHFEHRRVYFEVFGEETYNQLEVAKQQIVRKSQRPIKEIAAFYRSEYERMKALRRQGVTGRIEFDEYSFEPDGTGVH